MKKCPRCQETKPTTEFNKAKHTKDKLQGYCKECNKAKSREHWEKKRTAMIQKYGDACMICGDPPVILGPVLALDHCHKTGVERGVLCRDCNLGLGHFRDNPEFLRAAAAYLLRQP